MEKSFLHTDVSTLEKLLKLRLYRIPKYQRPYSWKKEQIDQIWEDLSDDTSLFLGSLMLNIVNEEKKGYVEVIDGQQRLTSITMLLSILIRKIMKTFPDGDEYEFAKTLHQQLIADKETVKGGKLSYVYRLTPGQSMVKFFKENIQNIIQVDFPKSKSSEEKTLIENYNSFEKLIDDEIEDLDSGKTYKFLVDKIERIKSTRFIIIEVKDDSQAYEIFESVNAKGMDLSTADLVKNKIFTHVKSVDKKESNVIWDDIIKNIESANGNMKDFLKYHWWSKYGYSSDKKLYKNIQNKFKKNENKWEEFLTELMYSSEYYGILMDGNAADIQKQDFEYKEAQKLFESIRALRTFSNDTWLVLALSLMRNHQKLERRVGDIFKRLEYLTFNYFNIFRLPSNTFYGKMWGTATNIEEIISDKNLTKKQKNKKINKLLDTNFNEIQKKYINQDKEIFIENFSQIKLGTSIKSKKLIRYILSSLESVIH